jgi:hypothetical protein
MFLIKSEQYFFGSYHFEKQTSFYKKLLYGLVITKCIHWLVFFDLLFSDNSLIYIRPYSSGSIKDLAFVLCNYGGANLNLSFILITCALSLLLLFSKSTYIAETIIWLLIINLHNRIYSTLSGGDHLLTQLLFFNIFLCKNASPSSLRQVFHNFAVLAIIIQVCLVYFLAALSKLGDETWLRGDAVQMIAGVDHFSTGVALRWPQPVYLALNYFVMTYQLLFPVLALLKRTKRPFLIVGIIMHLYIAFVTGLPGFAAIMIIAYVFFWPVKPANPEN